MRAPGLPGLLLSQWQVAIGPVLAALGAAVLYMLGLRRLRGRWPATRTTFFAAGLGALMLALCSGVERFADRVLSAHMVQHMLLLLIAPALITLGRPVELALRALPPAARPAPARTLRRAGAIANPAVCLATFSVVLLVTHLPGFYDATLSAPLLHDAEHALYLVAGGVMWWPILDGDPVPSRRLGGLGRLLYVIAAMVPMAVVGAYLNRHPTLVYPAYAPPARGLGISAVADQQQAGAIMWVLGDLVMVAGGLWAAMSAMVAEERRQQSRDRLRARELAR